MKFLKRSPFEAELRRQYPESQDDGWFYNSVGAEYRYKFPYTLSARVKLDTLIAKTCRIVTALDSQYPVYAFPDNFAAGWREFPKSRRRSPLAIANEGELADLIRNHICFRHPQRLCDNYHITDAGFRWFVIFCHHDDWHFFAPPPLVALAKKA
jgi:hypothetical protein